MSSNLSIASVAHPNRTPFPRVWQTCSSRRAILAYETSTWTAMMTSSHYWEEAVTYQTRLWLWVGHPIFTRRMSRHIEIIIDFGSNRFADSRLRYWAKGSRSTWWARPHTFGVISHWKIAFSTFIFTIGEFSQAVYTHLFHPIIIGIIYPFNKHFNTYSGPWLAARTSVPTRF